MDQGDGQIVQPGIVQTPGDRVFGRKGKCVFALGVHGKVHAQLRQGEPQHVPRCGGSVQLDPDLGSAVPVGHGEHVRDVAGLTVYRVGHKLKQDLPVLEAYDMTTEAVVAKLMWILGQTRDHAEISRLFYGSISHDMLYTEELPHEG